MKKEKNGNCKAKYIIEKKNFRFSIKFTYSFRLICMCANKKEKITNNFFVSASILQFLVYSFVLFLFSISAKFNEQNRGKRKMTSKNLSDASSAATSKLESTASTESAEVTSPRTEPINPELEKLSTKRDASWPSVLFYIHLNILGLYGITVLFTNAYLTTVIFTALLSFIGIIGVTCGAHRLWAHRTYEANTLLRLFLMLCQTMAGQVWNIRELIALN